MTLLQSLIISFITTNVVYDVYVWISHFCSRLQTVGSHPHYLPLEKLGIEIYLSNWRQTYIPDIWDGWALSGKTDKAKALTSHSHK